MIFGDVINVASPQWKGEMEAVLALFKPGQVLTGKEIRAALPGLNPGRLNRVLQQLTLAKQLTKGTTGKQLSRLRFTYRRAG